MDQVQHTIKISFPVIKSTDEQPIKTISFVSRPVTENVSHIVSPKGTTILTQLLTENGELFYPGETLSAGCLKIGGHQYVSTDGENFLLNSKKIFTYYFSDVSSGLRAVKNGGALRAENLIFLLKYCYPREDRLNLFKSFVQDQNPAIVTLEEFRMNLSPVNYILAESSSKTIHIRLAPDFYVFAGEIIGYFLSKKVLAQASNYYSSICIPDSTSFLITYGAYRELLQNNIPMEPEHVLAGTLVEFKPQVSLKNFYDTLSFRKPIDLFISALNTCLSQRNISHTNNYEFLLITLKHLYTEESPSIAYQSPRSCLTSSESDFLRHYNLFNSTIDCDARLEAFLRQQTDIFSQLATLSLSPKNWELLTSFSTNQPDILTSTGLYIIIYRWSEFLEANFPIQSYHCPCCSCPYANSSPFSCYCLKFNDYANHSEFHHVDSYLSNSVGTYLVISYIMRLLTVLLESLNLVPNSADLFKILDFASKLLYQYFFSHSLIVNDMLRHSILTFIGEILSAVKSGIPQATASKLYNRYPEKPVPMFLKLVHLFEHPDVRLELEKKWFYIDSPITEKRLFRMLHSKKISRDRVEIIRFKE